MDFGFARQANVVEWFPKCIHLATDFIYLYKIRYLAMWQW